MSQSKCPKCDFVNDVSASECARCGIIFSKFDVVQKRRKQSANQSCHVVDYQILGDDMQIVEVELDSGETVVAEAGAMNYMDDGIGFEAKMGDGSPADEGIMGKLLNVGKRVLTGESIFMTHFTNKMAGKKRVAFAAPYPGKIIPVDMAKVNKVLYCQKDAFLCAAHGTHIGISFTKRLGTGFFWR